MQKTFFFDKWNLFDFIIVIGGLAEQGLALESLSGLSVLRVLRIMRIFRLLKQAKRLNAIFNSFINTIPTFVNVFALIMILIFFYSVIGNQLFSLVKISGDMNDHINFKTYTNSIQTLIAFMAGEEWHDVMVDLSQPQKKHDYDCIRNPSFDDYFEAGIEFKNDF